MNKTKVKIRRLLEMSPSRISRAFGLLRYRKNGVLMTLFSRKESPFRVFDVFKWAILEDIEELDDP